MEYYSPGRQEVPAFETNPAARWVKKLDGDPTMMPSKSSGKRCASINASRPPFEQPLKYERLGPLPASALIMALDLSVVSLSARWP